MDCRGKKTTIAILVHVGEGRRHPADNALLRRNRGSQSMVGG